MNIKFWDRNEGLAYQGDLVLMPLPDSFSFNKTNLIKEKNNQIVLLEGEMTGHHHSIDVSPEIDWDVKVVRKAPNKSAQMTGDTLFQKGTARLYKDEGALDLLKTMGYLTRTDLAVGLLEVSDNVVHLRHQEHDGIIIPPGKYYVGRQIESVGTEERIVRD